MTYEFSVFSCTVSLQHVIHLSLQTISTKAVSLIAAIFLTQLWSAQACRLMLLPVLRLEFACTGGITPNYVVSSTFVFYYNWQVCWNKALIVSFCTQSFVMFCFSHQQLAIVPQTKFTSHVVQQNSQAVISSELMKLNVFIDDVWKWQNMWIRKNSVLIPIKNL